MKRVRPETPGTDAPVGEAEARRFSTTSRVAAAMQANNLTWESPVVDLIDALIYDGGFSPEDADTIVMRGVAR